MSIYSSGVEAYRDSTKWLAAFVPVTILATAGLTLGPRLLTSLSDSASLVGWLGDNWLVLVSGVLIAGALAALLSSGARVLSVEPSEIADLAADPTNTAALAEAIGAGAALPYFFDKTTFDAAMANLATTTQPLDPASPPMSLLVPAIDALREWSVFRQARRAYRRFLVTFGVSTLVMTVAVFLAALHLPSGG